MGERTMSRCEWGDDLYKTVGRDGRRRWRDDDDLLFVTGTIEIQSAVPWSLLGIATRDRRYAQQYTVPDRAFLLT